MLSTEPIKDTVQGTKKLQSRSTSQNLLCRLNKRHQLRAEAEMAIAEPFRINSPECPISHYLALFTPFVVSLLGHCNNLIFQIPFFDIF